MGAFIQGSSKFNMKLQGLIFICLLSPLFSVLGAPVADPHVAGTLVFLTGAPSLPVLALAGLGLGTSAALAGAGGVINAGNLVGIATNGANNGNNGGNVVRVVTNTVNNANDAVNDAIDGNNVLNLINGNGLNNGR